MKEKMVARFESGKEITMITSPEMRNRLDFYNWICMNRLGKKYGKVVEITCKPWAE